MYPRKIYMLLFIAASFIIDKTGNYSKGYINKWMDKQTMIYPNSWIPLRNKMNDWYIQYLGRISKHYIGQKNLDTKQYIMYSCLYLKFWKSKTNLQWPKADPKIQNYIFLVVFKGQTDSSFSKQHSVAPWATARFSW